MMSETVEGLQELFAKLDALPLHVGKILIARALREGAEPIRAQAANMAPDDPETSESRIRDNMKTIVVAQTATEALARIGPVSRDSDLRVSEAALAAEYGTVHESARPFLRPAFDERVKEASQIIAEVLGDEIDKAMAK